MGTRYKGAVKERRALDAFIKLTRAANSVTSVIDRVIASYDLTPSQFGTLEVLYHLGPLCQRDISEKLLMSGGNITMVVDNLEKQGYVRRERDNEDRRMVNVHLTDAGQKLIGGIFPDHVKVIGEVMGGLTASELDTLGDLCRKLGRHASVLEL